MDLQPIPYEVVILACTNQKEEGKPCCAARGSAALVERLKAVVNERGLKGKKRVVATGCLGKCALGPNMLIAPEGIWVSGVTEDDLPAIVDRYLQKEDP